MQAGSGSPPPENKKDIGSWSALHECAQELRRSDWPNVWLGPSAHSRWYCGGPRV